MLDLSAGDVPSRSIDGRCAGCGDETSRWPPCAGGGFKTGDPDPSGRPDWPWANGGAPRSYSPCWACWACWPNGEEVRGAAAYCPRGGVWLDCGRGKRSDMLGLLGIAVGGMNDGSGRAC